MNNKVIKQSIENTKFFENQIESELWTVEDVASYLKVSPKTIYGWIYQKKLKPIKLSHKIVRFNAHVIKQWVASK